MNPSLASLVFVIGVAGLFYLNRDNSVRTSRALWIPVIWFWILGSRNVSAWLGLAPTAGTATANVMMEGSPLDAFILFVLIASGFAVLVTRSQRCRPLLMTNWPIVLYFAYCLVSVVWSDYPDVSSKRWIKATGDVIMALVVVTDAQPIAALRRLFSRVGFVLIPASTLVIKYYPYLGRGYDEWTGQQFNMGVATDKNILGVTTYVLTLGAFWQVLRFWRDPKVPNRRRQFVAEGTLVGFGIWNLFTANSATSESCLMLAAFIMLLSGSRRFRGRAATVNALVLTVIVVGGLIKVTGTDEAVFHALGRNTNLTGRTDIWALLIGMAPNPLVGAGFESFWLGPRMQRVWDAFPNLYVTEAHNGYIELYLKLGAVGVTLAISILIHGYRRCVAAFRIDPDSSSLMLAYVLASAMYSYTEAGFRMLDDAWSFLVLAIMAASRISRMGQLNRPLKGELFKIGLPTTAVRTASVLVR